MGKLERNTLCLQDYSNVEVKTEKRCLILSLRLVVFCASGDEILHILFLALDLVGVL
jgi:hypothetical protein